MRDEGRCRDCRRWKTLQTTMVGSSATAVIAGTIENVPKYGKMMNGKYITLPQQNIFVITVKRVQFQGKSIKI